MMFRVDNPVNTGSIDGTHAPTVPREDRTMGQYTVVVTTSVSNGKVMMKPLQSQKLSLS